MCNDDSGWLSLGMKACEASMKMRYTGFNLKARPNGRWLLLANFEDEDSGTKHDWCPRWEKEMDKLYAGCYLVELLNGAKDIGGFLNIARQLAQEDSLKEAVAKAEAEVTSRPVDLESVRKHWKLIVQSLSGEGRLANLDAFVRSSCEPIALDNDILTLGFYYSFHLEKMKERCYQELLESKISEVLETPIKLEYVVIKRKSPNIG